VGITNRPKFVELVEVQPSTAGHEGEDALTNDSGRNVRADSNTERAAAATINPDTAVSTVGDGKAAHAAASTVSGNPLSRADELGTRAFDFTSIRVTGQQVKESGRDIVRTRLEP
jgi:hypothetical protein